MISKIYLIFLFSILLALPFLSAVICEDITEEKNVPCEIITEKMNCDTNALIYTVTNQSFNFSIVMNKMDSDCLSNCFYNFTFNYSRGDYGINTCDGKYARVKVIANSSNSTLDSLNSSIYNLLTTINNQNSTLTTIINNILSVNNTLQTIKGGRDIYYTISTGIQYSRLDNALFIMTLENSSGSPLHNQNVTLNVYYPNSSVFINQSLLEVENSGIYQLIRQIPSSAPFGSYIANFMGNQTLGSIVFKVINSNPDNSSFMSLVNPTSSGNLSSNSIIANSSYFSTFNVNRTFITLSNSSGIMNVTNVSGYLVFTNLSSGTYYLNATLIDSNLDVFNSENRVIILDQSFPNILAVNSSVMTNSATIYWTTDKLTNTSLLFGVNPLNFERIDSAYSLAHSINLTSLIAGQLYFFNITSCDSFNNCNHSIIYNFTTNPESPRETGNWHPLAITTFNFSTNNSFLDSYLDFLSIKYQESECANLQKYRFFLGIKSVDNGCEIVGIKWWIILSLILIILILMYFVSYLRIKRIESTSKKFFDRLNSTK